MLVGGFFLYVSYYGCDQTQAQRILAAADDDQARKALTVASLVRFPLVATYCLFGLMLAAFLAATPDFAQSLANRPPDALVPQFLVGYLPVGVLGVVIAGILAAALSSIDSALNSLSAVVVEEFVPSGTERRLTWARLATVGWGVLATAAAWVFSRSGETSIELVNRVGSALYGPVLAVFLLAWRSKRADGWSAVAGAVAGLLANLTLAAWAPGISWLWWNVVGCGVALVVGVLFGRSSAEIEITGDRAGRGYARLLVLYFAVILVVLGVVCLAL
jgi:SSS family solute:Na+ symporter